MKMAYLELSRLPSMKASAIFMAGRVEDGRGSGNQTAPFPIPAHRTGRADLPHRALRQMSPPGSRTGGSSDAAQTQHAQRTKDHVVRERARAALAACQASLPLAIPLFERSSLISANHIPQPLRFDLREGLPIHARGTLVELQQFVGVAQNIFPVDFVVEQVEYDPLGVPAGPPSLARVLESGSTRTGVPPLAPNLSGWDFHPQVICAVGAHRKISAVRRYTLTRKANCGDSSPRQVGAQNDSRYATSLRASPGSAR
jgi:hypothetical protein